MEKKRKNISWRHHYLPVFYLKGFTKEIGQFKIYDVQQKRFLRDCKWFSPQSQFFEEDANTISIGDYTSDELETKYYADFDNTISKLYMRLHTSSPPKKFGLTDDDMPILNQFVSLMYWRLPHRRKEIDVILKNNTLETLGIKVSDKDGIINKEYGEKFKNDPLFTIGFRYFNSIVDSLRGIKCSTPYSIFKNSELFPFLCSDNPVLFEKEFLPGVHEDDFIFPLSGDTLFIRAQKTSNFDPYLRIMVDTLVFKQAIRYVSCTDERYIDLLEDGFEKYFHTKENLRAALFNRIK